MAASLTLPQPRAFAPPAPSALFWPLAGLAIVVAAHLYLAVARAINWDEFFHYSQLHVLAQGGWLQPLQTIHTRLFAWALDLPGGPVERDSRISGGGALSGISAGVAGGAAYGLVQSWGVRPGRGTATLLLTVAAMVAGNGPLTMLKVSDPRQWSPGDWAADVLPHLAYGLVTAATYDR